MNFLREMFQRYIQTALEIMETSQTSYLPQKLYILIFGIFQLQLLSFTYSSDDYDRFSDDKLQFLSDFSDYMSISYTIKSFEKDSLSLLWFIFLAGITHSFLIYIAIITYLKTKFPRFYAQIQWLFEYINTKLNIYFTIYPWIFFISFIETNSEILACGKNSFLKKYQNEDKCYEKPFYHYFLTIIALIVSLCMCFIVLFFFRNRTFCEKNIIRRRFNFTLIFTTLLSFIIVLSYYLFEDSSPRIKNILSIFFGALQIYDATINMPFSNIDMNRYVACISCIFFVSQISLLIWLENPNVFQENDIFYSISIISAVFCGAILSIIHIQQDKYLKLQTSELQKKSSQQKCVNFLEEIYKLGMEYQNDKYSRFKLGEVLAYHQSTCTSIICYCKHIQTQNFTEKMISDQIILLIDSFFQQYLQHQNIQSNQNEFEYISLKYISFLSKSCNNSLKAFYMLKTLENKRTKKSFYFQNIQKIMSVQLQEMIAQDSQFRNYHFKSINESCDQTISVKSIYQTDILKEKGIQLLLTFLEKKKQFYQKLKEGYSSIKLYSEEAIELGKVGDYVKKEIDQIFSEKNKKNLDINNNITLLKLQSIYLGLVHKKVQQSMHFEEKSQDNALKMKQRQINFQEVTNHQQENVEVIEVSLIKDKGKITKNNQIRLGHFFGYDVQEFQQKTFELRDLMPKYIGEIHDNLINNMIKRGYNKFSNSRLSTFGRDNQGFIFPISLQIDVQQGVDDDFRLIASILKLTENQNHIILTDEFGSIEGMTQNFYKKIIQNDENQIVFERCQNKLKSTYSFKEMPSNKSFKEGKITSYQFNIFLILQTLIDKIIAHQEQTNLLKNDDKSVNKSILNQERTILKIPQNLKKLNQLMNYQIKDLKKNDIYQTIQKFMDDSQDELLEDNCMNTYTIVYNLNFELFYYEIDNQKREKQMYIIEITEIEQLIDKQDSFQSYDNSLKHMPFQSTSTKKSSGSSELISPSHSINQFQSPNISYKILSPHNINNCQLIQDNSSQKIENEHNNIPFSYISLDEKYSNKLLAYSQSYFQSNTYLSAPIFPSTSKVLNDQMRNNLSRQSTTERAISRKIKESNKIDVHSSRQKLEQNIDEEKKYKMEFKNKVQHEMNSSCSANSSQRYSSYDISRFNTQSFHQWVSSYLNILICNSFYLFFFYTLIKQKIFQNFFYQIILIFYIFLILLVSFSAIVVTLILILCPQVYSVFKITEKNTQFAYITSHLDYYLSHQISNSLAIKLSNKTINYEYSPYSQSYLSLKTKNVAKKYIDLVKEGRGQLIYDSQYLESWLNESNQFQVKDVIVMKLQFITNMIELIHFRNLTNQEQMYLDDQSFNFIMRNLLISKQITSKQLEIQHEDIKNNIKKIINIGYIYCLVFLGLFIAVFSIWLYFIKRFSQVNKRILMLIARISWQECEVEEIKQDYCIQLLKSVDQSWTNKNFIDIIKFQTTEKIKSIQNKKQGRNVMRQSFLSSQIDDQSYNQWKYILISFIVSISTFIFFSSGILFLNGKWSCINETTNLYYKVAYQKLSYSTIGLYPDLLAADYVLEQKSKDYPKFEILENYNYYTKQIENIKSGIEQFTLDIQSLETLSTSNITSIRKIFEQDACFDMKDTFGYCERKKIQTNQATIIGLASEIEQDLQYLSQFKDLFSHTIPDNQVQTQIDMYFNNIIHQQFPSRSFELIFMSLHTIQTILYQSSQNTMNSVFSIFTATLKLITPIMVFSWLCICIYLKNILLSNSKKINFILTCIPFSKLQEDITISMLKKIENM